MLWSCQLNNFTTKHTLHYVTLPFAIAVDSDHNLSLAIYPDTHPSPHLYL